MKALVDQTNGRSELMGYNEDSGYIISTLTLAATPGLMFIQSKVNTRIVG